MATIEERPVLDARVSDVLANLRARIRRYVWIEGLAATLFACGALFWAMLAIDWLFEPPVALRRVLLVGAIGVVGYVIYRFILRRAFVPLTDANMAVLLERRFAPLEESLLTAVDLAGRGESLPEFGREMFSHTCDDAARRAVGLDVAQVFDRRPLARAVLAAVAAGLSLALLALLAPATARFGIERLAGLTDEPWPRRTRLVVIGFENGEKVIARGDDLEVHVQADTAMELVPEVVQIRYRTEEGVRDRVTMNREGNAVPQRDPYQDFKYQFQSVPSNRSFDVLGGDARVRDLKIRVVDSPALVETTLFCEYPEYMHRAARELPVTGSVQIPLGTKVTVRCRANKDLVKAQIDYALDKDAFTTQTIDDIGADGDPRQFEFTLDSLNSDKTLSFTLFDTDGIHNRKPILVSLSAVEDETPQVSAQLRGIGSEITPNARLPLVGSVRDDYGIAGAAFVFNVDDKPAEQRPFTADPAGRTEWPVDEAFEVEPLALKPGQKLVFGSQATDAYHLVEGDKPHVGAGERFQLDVVTPDALRTLLESRELNLRQRFETIMQEVTDTRDSLAALEFGKAKKPSEPPPPASGDPPSNAPGEEPATDGGVARDHLRLERALQNSQKNAQETLGVATSFETIREELINNRIDTEEWKSRLKESIADPLHRVGEEMFPEFDRRLAVLQAKLPDAGAAPAAHQEAIAQADAILIEMAKVRDKMLELENFNEAIDLLRAIIANEQSLVEQAKARQKKKLRDLLEDDK